MTQVAEDSKVVYSRIHFIASPSAVAQTALRAMLRRYGQHELDQADVIVALGGDGFMLRTLHRLISAHLPVYGMKLGNVGFLMNRYREKQLPERLAAANPVELAPLCMVAATEAGSETRALAINEVSLLRQMNQAAHIRVSINGSVKVEELVCDGVLVATPAGSSAYNLSARGPILPLGTAALALTPISPFRPRRWHGAVLPSTARFRFDVIDCYKRPVSATADAQEVRNVISVDVYQEQDIRLKLLFDPDHSLEDRILDEQFL